MALHGPHHVAKQSTMTLSCSFTTFLNSSALDSLVRKCACYFDQDLVRDAAHVLT